MVGNEFIHRRNVLLFCLMGAFYLIQVTINILIEGIDNVFPPAYLFIVAGILLLTMIIEKINANVTMYVMVICIYLYFYMLLNDSPYLVNYLFMWLALPLSAIYQNYKVVLLAFTGSVILTWYSFFYLHQEIFPNVGPEDFVYLILFGVFLTVFLLSFNYITLQLWAEVKEKNAKLQVLAYYDHLTGAANRLLLKKEFARLKEAEIHSIGVLFVDLNGFKSINDTYGHDAGDQLLKKVVSRINGEMMGTELLCRLGGDEFVILISNKDQLTIKHLLEHIHHTLKKPFNIQNETMQVSASIGWSYTTEVSDSDLDEMIREADGEMYLSKAK